ncbi:PhzF family phenazine biosynthesis protein [Aquimarina litoralis]|uniref:PhzF family phenazine biosynthesis protein n=1 Tax=Aquimarina litoralis TaxID=584605 RepID=UPI001C56F4EB|nr:PhzF family phenazine biosynthesis protein [Aquimarina litoralis]MBW1296294.1 PhzF family phenazine biosynthesis isomerase [Aquimarina litoralis]
MDKSKLIIVQILNAFAENNKGGNPAGVVLGADNLSHEYKLEIAKKVGLSETAFVSQSQTADFKLDFYTPTKQIAHCGHATIATFSYLKQLGRLTTNDLSKETIDGNRKIKIIDELAFMEQMAPKYSNVKDKEIHILESLGLTKNQIIDKAPIQVVNTGNSFLIVPVKSSEDLASIKPNYDQINKVSEELDLIGYYVFTNDMTSEKLDATSRMFAPRYGILEESGTGMAAGPLACYLYDILKVNKKRFQIQQGKFMEKPSQSLIIVDLNIEHHQIKSLMAGGKGILKNQLEIEIS